MIHDTIVALAAVGVAGQVLAGALLLAAGVALAGARAPLRAARTLVWGYELWAGFVVAAIATGGSLFFSDIAEFTPCELCWYQRICMYPLSIVLLLAALANEHRLARYLLPLPLVGAGVSTYQLLIENGAIEEPQACFVSSPGGCGVKWVNEFGYMTIPTLALTAFALVFAFLLFATFEAAHA